MVSQVWRGKRGRARATKMESILRARLDRWEGGEYGALWMEALSNAKNHREDPSNSTSCAINVRRAICCAENEWYAKVVVVLFSLGMCSPSNKAIVSMMENRPIACALVLSKGPPPPPMVFLSEIVKGRLQIFPNNSDIKPQYFKDIDSTMP